MVTQNSVEVRNRIRSSTRQEGRDIRAWQYPVSTGIYRDLVAPLAYQHEVNCLKQIEPLHLLLVVGDSQSHVNGHLLPSRGDSPRTVYNRGESYPVYLHLSIAAPLPDCINRGSGAPPYFRVISADGLAELG